MPRWRHGLPRCGRLLVQTQSRSLGRAFFKVNVTRLLPRTYLTTAVQRARSLRVSCAPSSNRGCRTDPSSTGDAGSAPGFREGRTSTSAAERGPRSSAVVPARPVLYRGGQRRASRGPLPTCHSRAQASGERLQPRLARPLSQRHAGGCRIADRITCTCMTLTQRTCETRLKAFTARLRSRMARR